MDLNAISDLDKKQWWNAMGEAWGVKPKEQNTLATRTALYARYLWRLVYSSVEIKLPDYWSYDYFRFTLLAGGSIAVTEWKGVTVCAAFTVLDRNAWDYPIHIKEGDKVRFGKKTVGEDAEIIYLDSVSLLGGWIGGSGLSDIIQVYAEKLANCDASIDINLFNTRSAYIFEVMDKGEADDMRSLYTRIASGLPAVFWRKSATRKLDSKAQPPITTLPVKQNFIADMVQDEKRAIVNEFLTMIGINNNNIEKKERLLTDEINANNQEVECAVRIWQDNVDRCIDNVKKIFPDVDITIKFKGAQEEGVENVKVDRPTDNVSDKGK